MPAKYNSNQPSILFLCTGNSCRSQMAEGWARHLRQDLLRPYSAGIEAHGLNEHAVTVMREVGVEISRQKSKTVKEMGDIEFDYVVTVCSNADENCPYFPVGTNIVHHGFDDPPRLAASAASAEEALRHYRRVRDEIKAYVLTLPAALI